MRLRDISLRKRLWAANLLMVIVPLGALLAIGSVLLALLHLADADHLGPLSLFWPERGPSLTVQYLVSDLRNQVDKAGKKSGKDDETLKDLLADCRRFEQHGVHLAVLRNGSAVYVTPGSNPGFLDQQITQRVGSSRSAELWTEDVFALRYAARRGDAMVLAYGRIAARPAPSEAAVPMKQVLEYALFFALLVLILLILALGRYLSRVLDRQVLRPLAQLVEASAAIRRGEFDHALTVKTHDEVGQACAGFERMRQALCQARQERLHYEENRKEFIAGISHDLRTPLTAIRGYVSGLRDGIARTEEKREHYLAMIYDSVLLLEHLVNNLFLFSKLDLGRMEFHLEKTCLYAYLTHYLQSVDLGTQRVRFKLLPQAGTQQAQVMLDPLQFQRVLDNLLSNSRKYSGQKDPAIDIRLAREGKELLLFWQDHGVGVDPSKLPRLFDSFYRADQARSRVADGSGLGLAIVKEILSGMQGRAEAQLTPGGGLTIALHLPLVADAINGKQKGDGAFDENHLDRGR